MLGTVAAKAVHPAATGEPVSHRTSIGNAIVLIRVPSADTDEPARSSRKGRPLIAVARLLWVSSKSDIRHQSLSRGSEFITSCSSRPFIVAESSETWAARRETYRLTAAKTGRCPIGIDGMSGCPLD